MSGVLFASAEIFPFAKTGGLADVAGALPKALARQLSVTTLMPLYRFVDRERFRIRPTGRRLRLKVGERRFEVELFAQEEAPEGVEALFVYEPTLCDRNTPYGPPGSAYPDNDLRFAIFCHTIVALCERSEGIGLLHLNDWHTALAAPLVRDRGVGVKVVYTIHNLAYQGLFPPDSLKRCGIGSHHFTLEDMEFYGQVNWMKGGIAHADAVTTVSPSYAREILRPEFGCGLDGFLRRHARKLRGILNGIDTAFFDPARDPALPAPYSASSPEGKAICRQSFLKEIDIDKYEYPLFVFIGRFVPQKGIDLLLEGMETMGRLPLTLAILGDGDEGIERAFGAAARRLANVHVRFGYDEALSHRMYAAADFLLMPSRFEPCGLNQMIAMRYGTVPIVHAVGGLKDTVHPRGPTPRCGLGFPFDEASVSGLIGAVEEALALYGRPDELAALRTFDMGCDFSVTRSASEYVRLYRSLT